MDVIKRLNRWAVGIAMVLFLLAQPADACLRCKWLNFGVLNSGLYICLFNEWGGQSCNATDTECSTFGRCTVVWA